MTDLRTQILHAMRRLASKGRASVSPSMIADHIEPRPSYGDVCAELSRMYVDELVNDGRIGIGRYTLPPAPYVEPAEQLALRGDG